jgi:hypothetical protein
MRSCLVVGRVFLISGQKVDVSRGCLSDRVAMLQMSNALKSTSEGRSPKVCRATVLPSPRGVEASASQEALPGGAKLLENQLAVVSRLERAGVSGLGSANTRRGCRRSRYKQRIRTAYDGPAKLDSRRAATQILSPHLREPAAARQIRTWSPGPCLSCCAALEVRTFLLSPRPAGVSLNTCTCLVCATPPYRRPYPYRTYIESNTRKRALQRALISTLRILEAPAATRGL